MRFFTGQFERTIDDKNRIQLPSRFRAILEPEKNGPGLYVTLGEEPKTLAIFTVGGFEAIALRAETQYESDEDWRRFELQFGAMAEYVEMDKQGRVVLPERLLRMARLSGDVALVGRLDRIQIWKPADLDQALGINWSGDDWPVWHPFMRRRPGGKEPPSSS